MGYRSVSRALAIIVMGFVLAHAPRSLASDAPSELHLLQSAIAIGANPDGTPIEVRTFYKNEDIQFYTKLSFDAARGSGVEHRLLYKWYTGDAVSLTFAAKKKFDVSPTYWWAFTHVAHFTSGHHRAELYIDDQLFASSEFDTKAIRRPTEPQEDTAIKESALALLLDGDIPRFAELANRYRASEERTASGTWKLSLLYNAIEGPSFAPQDPQWKVLQDLTDSWLAREPDSPTAVALNARVLYSHAWSWRGDGPASTATSQNWQRYQQLIEQTRGVLDQHPGVSHQDPEWDTLRISIARQQGADSQDILAMADRALRRWPYYYPIHNATTNALLPRWGGSRADIQAYVRLALERSHAHEGTQAYARIYYYISRTTDRDALDDLNLMGARWAPMQQSLAELLAAYPSSFNYDVARAITCFASQEATYRMLGRAATGDITAVAWWDTREARRGCNEWAFEGKHARGSLLWRASKYLSFWRGFGPELWQPLRWVVLLTILLIEAGLWLLERLARSVSNGIIPAGKCGIFNPLDYPRTYHLIPGRFSIRLGVWMAVFAATAAYLVTTVPSPDPQETTLVTSGLIAIASAGVLIAINVLASRVVLTAEELRLRSFGGNHVIQRNDILGIRRYTAQTGRQALKVVPRVPGTRPLLIPAVLREDDGFRLWFNSLPSLTEEEAPNRRSASGP